MRRVFIPQKPLRWDPAKQELVPPFDLTPAEHFGELVYLTGPRGAPWSEAVIKELKTQLSKQEYHPARDYLLLLGNPCLIGATTAFAARMAPKGTPVRVLQWNGRERDYIVVDMDLH